MYDEFEGLPVSQNIDPKNLQFVDDLSEKQLAKEESNTLMEKVYTGFHDLINH